MQAQDLVAHAATWTRIDEVLRHHAQHTPAAPCATFEDRHWLWAEFETLVDRAAQALAAAGVVAGDRIALLSTPRPEYLLILMAASRLGAVYVGLNPRYTPAELAQALVHVQPRLVLTLRAFEGQDFLALLAAAATTVTLPPVLPFACIDSLMQALQTLAGPLPTAGSAATPDAPTHAALHHTAAIVFTSGTTGTPKAAMLTHRGLLHAAAVQHLRLNTAPARYLCNLPVNHVGCLMNLTLAALVGGGSIVFQQRFSAAHALHLIHDEGVNCWLQVPAMFHACVQDPAFDPRALGHLHSICIGGGALSVQTLRKLRQTGVPLFVEYGQTETSSSAAYSDAGASDDVLSHSVGRFDPHFEFRVADTANRPCAVGEVGEIQGRGRLLFAGYYGDPEATRAAFTSDGWLRTGDLACLRADGNVELKGRLREMIKSGGYNIYPREVELVLECHPAISQVVVLGMPDERYGEAVHAVIGGSAAPPQLDELLAHCRRSLANYKVPKSFRVVQAFPLLANGKVDRVRTRTMAAELPTLD
jgi:acyl-CoA synthetase (AMP-forming)/AMP-acid ligase II